MCSILLARVSWIQRFVKEQAFIAGLTARREGLIVAVLVGMLVLLPRTGCAQAPPLDGKSGRELLLRNFRPVPMLKVPEHLLKRAKFPVVDLHTHFFHRLKHSPDQLEHFVELMNRHNIAVCVSLDGRLGERFDEHRKYLWTKHRDRFLIFVNIDWTGRATGQCKNGRR